MFGFLSTIQAFGFIWGAGRRLYYFTKTWSTKYGRSDLRINQIFFSQGPGALFIKIGHFCMGTLLRFLGNAGTILPFTHTYMISYLSGSVVLCFHCISLLFQSLSLFNSIMFQITNHRALDSFTTMFRNSPLHPGRELSEATTWRSGCRADTNAHRCICIPYRYSTDSTVFFQAPLRRCPRILFERILSYINNT